MATPMESRLTILAIVSFSITFWLFISVLINLSQDCGSSDDKRMLIRKNISVIQHKDIFRYHFVATLILKTHREQALQLRICDASILNPFWTITTASCLSIFEEAKNYHIRIKSNSHYWKAGQEHRIQKYLIHRKYLENQTNYDVSLIKIIEPIVGVRVSYIKTASSDYNYKVNSSALVVSWSIQNNQASLDPKKLKKLPVLFLEADCCRKMYSIKQNVEGVTGCAGTYSRNSKCCTYGSGAPLVQDKTLVGIISQRPWCTKCPALYVKMSYFQESIQQVLYNEESQNNTEFITTLA